MQSADFAGRRAPLCDILAVVQAVDHDGTGMFGGWIMKRRAAYVLSSAILAIQGRARGAIVYDVPAGNTTPLNNNVIWNSVGAFGSGGGVVIGTNTFITVDHVGGESPGGPFSLVTTVNNVTTTTTYTTTAAAVVPTTDLVVFQVNGTFAATSIAPLYTGTAAQQVGASLSMVGNGYATQGAAIVTNSVTNGWYWAGNQVKNYSQNTVYTVANDSLTNSQSLDYLFQPISGQNEGIYASGDSGGGAFIFNGGEFQLAGLADNIAPAYYQETSPGVYTLLSDGHAGAGVFDAAIYDGTNLYVEVSPGDYETANSQGYQNEYGVASDIQEYESQILLAQASLVPEPASGAILLGMLSPLALRRRRGNGLCQRGR